MVSDKIGAASGWRTANTESIKAGAAKHGINLKFADAQQKQENQIKALRSFTAQGVDVIAFSPVVEWCVHPAAERCVGCLEALRRKIGNCGLDR